MNHLPIHTIVLASNNAGKHAEMQALLKKISITLIAQNDLSIEPIEETGLTFIENALAKARHASLQSGLPALADDSGIIVDALDGKPGVHSHRYAGKSPMSPAHFERLLRDLQSVPTRQRTAHYYAVVVFLLHPEDPEPLIGQGIWEGLILKKPRGKNGFGHDPVFYIPSLKKSVAELPNHIKNTLSHRGQATRQVIKQLKQRYLVG